MMVIMAKEKSMTKNTDKRDVPLTANTVYCVMRENGSHYKVYSKKVLDAKIERGEIADTDRVVIQRVQ